MASPKLLTVSEVAESLNLSPWTIRAWIAAKKIESVRLGTALRVPQTEVSRLLAEGTVHRTSPP